MAIYQNDAPSVNVGDRLREIRTSREMSLRVLAMKSGLSILLTAQPTQAVSSLFEAPDKEYFIRQAEQSE